MYHNCLWTVLQHSYGIPTKLISIIRALHEHSVAAIRCLGRLQMSLLSQLVSVRAVYWLPHSLIYNLMWQMYGLENGQLKGRGVGVAYLHGAKLMGNCRKLQHKAIISDLEYADDKALVAESWDDLKSMMDDISIWCRDLGLTIAVARLRLWQSCHQNSIQSLCRSIHFLMMTL